MLKNNITIFFWIFLLCGPGCGVKGKPTPPDESPTIGGGESLYEKQKKKNEDKLRIKNRSSKDSTSSP